MMIETMKFLLASLARMSKKERVLIMQSVENNFCAACGDMSEPEKMPSGRKAFTSGSGWQCSICSAQRVPMIDPPLDPGFPGKEG